MKGHIPTSKEIVARSRIKQADRALRSEAINNLLAQNLQQEFELKFLKWTGVLFMVILGSSVFPSYF